MNLTLLKSHRGHIDSQISRKPDDTNPVALLSLLPTFDACEACACEDDYDGPNPVSIHRPSAWLNRSAACIGSRGSSIDICLSHDHCVSPPRRSALYLAGLTPVSAKGFVQRQLPSFTAARFQQTWSRLLPHRLSKCGRDALTAEHRDQTPESSYCFTSCLQIVSKSNVAHLTLKRLGAEIG